MKKKILIITVLFNTILFIAPVLTAGLGDAGKIAGAVADKAGVTEKSLPNIIGTGINAALTLVGLVFLILMVYAGYLWMTARGEEEVIKKSQKIIISTIIGLVILMSAYAITKFVAGKF